MFCRRRLELPRLRLGADPRVVVTTTPKPIRIIRELIADPTTVITRGSTYDNRANLAPAFLEQIIRKYEGTRLGRMFSRRQRSPRSVSIK
jgi:phage terminase large subunit-like protein